MEIRYGCDVAFDVTMPVAMQRCALARMRAWAEAHGDGFVPGRVDPSAVSPMRSREQRFRTDGFAAQ
jgi:hypothetical protein